MRFVGRLIAAFACLSATGFAFNLDCVQLMDFSWEVIVSTYTCKTQEMDIRKRGQQMTSTNVIHDINRVRGILIHSNLEQQIVHYVPKFTDQLARRLEALYIFNCRLKSITKEDLEQFPAIRNINLGMNDLELLEGDLFEANPRLEYVSFYANKLRIVGSNIFDALPILKEVIFGNNGCIEYGAARTPEQMEILKSHLQVRCQPSETLKLIEENKRLKELEKQFEAETKRTSESFNQNSKSCSENLYVVTKLLAPLLWTTASRSSYEEIVDVICEKYSAETKVCKVIKFQTVSPSNKFGSMEDENGIDLSPTTLIIRQQNALFLPTNMNEVFPNLEHLEFSETRIFTIYPKTFNYLNKLSVLNLTRNKILDISIYLFAGLEKLAVLDLSHNNLELLEDGAFDGLTALTSLSLNANKIKNIAMNFLSSSKSIQALDLSENVCIDSRFPETSMEKIEITIAEECTQAIEFSCVIGKFGHICHVEGLRVQKPNLKVSKVLGINSGKSAEIVTALVVEDQFVKFMPLQLSQTFPKLEKLVVFSSRLTMLAKNDLSGFDELKFVKITNNRLKSIESGTFDPVRQLDHLDLSSNHIRSLPPKIFTELAQLRVLRLSFNHIKTLISNILPATNSINIFQIDYNELEVIDSSFLNALKNSEIIDLSSNNCVDVKYDKKKENSEEELLEVFKAVDVHCSSTDR